MRGYIQSLRYALDGLTHAFSTERNFKLFVVLYVLSLLLSTVFRITPWEFQLVILSGGFFLAVELMNTALEHFSDAFDVHTKKQDDAHATAIKRTKDIAAASSLVCAIVWVIILATIFGKEIVLF